MPSYDSRLSRIETAWTIVRQAHDGGGPESSRWESTSAHFAHVRQCPTTRSRSASSSVPRPTNRRTSSSHSQYSPST